MERTWSELSDHVSRSILELHVSKGPARDYILWHECGKRLGGQRAIERAQEYSEAIISSIFDVEKKTGEYIDPDHVVAILFRESSHDECVIGKQETRKLTEQLGRAPKKKEIIAHVKTWIRIYSEARKDCREKNLPNDMKCIGRYFSKTSPEYRGIHGWDLGGAQYRWPGGRMRGRHVVLPCGRTIEGVTLKEIFDFDVAIQMLVEDLAYFKKACRNHTHWLRSRNGRKIRKLDPEEAYWVHHHSGEHRWSERYWKRVNRHLEVIRNMKSSSLLSSL